MNVSVISGGLGFIGLNLLKRLEKENRLLFVLDNLSRGKKEYLDTFSSNQLEKIKFIEVNLANLSKTLEAFNEAKGTGTIDEVWHLAANSDILKGTINSEVDLNDTFLTTYSIIESMKHFNVKTIHFASSSAIYGDHHGVVMHENTGPLLPISNYGAMKLASEGLISASAESFLERVNIFRFPNVVGSPATHGVIYDLFNKMKNNFSILNVLGDGSQRKSYLHVNDLIDAMMYVRGKKDLPRVYPINIGPADQGVSVKFIAESVRDRVNPNATICYGIGNKGWVGDVPFFTYSIDRLLNLGWKPSLNSESAIRLAVEEIAKQNGF